MEAIDLGLSVKWASCNIGATVPEECGNYYAWGETIPKNIYEWGTYKWCSGSSTSNFTKYCTSSSYGTVDNKTTLEPEDDAARANWGGKWRMPSTDEWTELYLECRWTWTDNYNSAGVAGRIVTSNINGNSIFLPAAGCHCDDVLLAEGSIGHYWSSSLNTGYPGSAWYVLFYSGGVSRDSSGRFCGQSIRPVYNN